MRRYIVPMVGRDDDEQHRASTPLELFFDLVIVVAIAAAGSSLHHGIAEDDIARSILGYGMTFFAIWWAWMNFSWFATAYDTDDVPYRIAVFVQMSGAIIIAAGITRAFADNDWTIVLAGYMVMRVALVALWIRAAIGDPEHRPNSIRWVVGITAAQVGWVLIILGPPELLLPGFFVLMAVELAVPIWAARAHRLRWHSEHIAERYGLLTIIVLGESVLAGTVAFTTAADEGASDVGLLSVALGALLVVFSMWWLYFERYTGDLLTSLRRSFEWGYGHYFIWASAAAVGGGIAVAVDVATHHAHVDTMTAGASVAIPVAVYIGGIWVLHDLPRPMSRLRMALSPIAVGLVLLTPFTPYPVVLAGAVVVGLLAAKIATTPSPDELDAELAG